jgi:chromosome segregation ATPase
MITVSDLKKRLQWWNGICPSNRLNFVLYSIFVDAITQRDERIVELESDAAITQRDERIVELEGELSKHQESEFHPNWSMLEATRDSLRICWSTIRERNERITALKAEVTKLHESDHQWNAMWADKCLELSELQTEITQRAARIAELERIVKDDGDVLIRSGVLLDKGKIIAELKDSVEHLQGALEISQRQTRNAIIAADERDERIAELEAEVANLRESNYQWNAVWTDACLKLSDYQEEVEELKHEVLRLKGFLALVHQAAFNNWARDPKADISL